ncbi:hypothetical protein EBR56_04840 [bacterium]|nr:hypothetical protein [bacterium]
MNWCVVTVATTSHLAGVGALAESLRLHHPNIALHACLVEGVARRRRSAGLEQVPCFDARDCFPTAREWARFSFQYPAFPLAAALKPRALRHVLLKTAADAVIFLDSDIFVTAPLDPLLESLEAGSIVITPHRIRPSRTHADVARLVHGGQMGTYNSGVVATRSDATGCDFLDWWAVATLTDCVDDRPRRVFVDQSWLEFVPALFAHVVVCRNPGVNVGYWNLDERSLALAGGCWHAGSEPLCTFHFSGFDPANPEPLSRYADPNHVAAENIRAVAPLARDYAAAVLRHGHDECSTQPYAFQTLTDGTRIEPPWRELFRSGHESVASIDDPFDAMGRVSGINMTAWYRRHAHAAAATSTASLAWWRFKDLWMRFGRLPGVRTFLSRFAAWRQVVAEARRWH